MNSFLPIFFFLFLYSFTSAQVIDKEFLCEPIYLQQKGFNSGSQIWPSQIIPYEITGDARFAKDAINAGIREINSKTNVCLVPKNRGELGAITFIASESNISSAGLGYNPSGVTIRIDIENGGQKSIVIHEIGHALGFQHEHQRPDRDEYITVNLDNVQSAYTFTYSKIPGETITPYDYRSIMHYYPSSFSINPRIPVMVGKNGETLGPEGSLTSIDIVDINHYYPQKLSCDSLYALFPPSPRFNYTRTYSSWCKGYGLRVRNTTQNSEHYSSYWEIKQGGRVVKGGFSQDTTFYLDGGVYEIGLTLSNRFGSNFSSQVTSLKEPEMEVFIYPNPVKDILTFKVNGDMRNMSYSIWNLEGKKLLEKERTIGLCMEEEKVELPGIGRGLYLLKVQTQDHIMVKSFIRNYEM